MTFIQPHKSSSLLNLVLASLVVLLLLGTGSLIVLYNHVVNLNHEIAADKATLDSVGAKNTALSNEAMAAQGDDQGASLAAGQGLVTDDKPEYFREPMSQAVAVK
jgi:cell division protein FtsB